MKCTCRKAAVTESSRVDFWYPPKRRDQAHPASWQAQRRYRRPSPGKFCRADENPNILKHLMQRVDHLRRFVSITGFEDTLGFIILGAGIYNQSRMSDRIGVILGNGDLLLRNFSIIRETSPFFGIMPSCSQDVVRQMHLAEHPKNISDFAVRCEPVRRAENHPHHGQY